MKYIWDGSLETGVEVIDTQHKQLFDAINMLLETCSAGKGVEEIKKSIDFLNDYTIKHFFEEERIQQKYHYPEYPEHKQYHDAFKATVRELTHRLILKGATEELVNEVHSSVGNWLVSHIRVQDFKLARYIKTKDAVSV
ncbi:MAG: hemerythrin family protein [Spirochaetaceae bacterium]|jgi:hemerythrin|nr:hemerythrin family protein [Spirochaetaceae bacterium]